MSIDCDNFIFVKTALYDMYTSESVDDSEAIIYCHGGAFRYGSRSDNSDFLISLSKQMSMRVYSIEFRNLDEARSLRTMIDDIKLSIEAIIKNDAISHIHIIGASSGAYLVWILSLMIANPMRYNIGLDFKVKTITLVSGYFLFKNDDSITKMLCLFPSFQCLPDEIKNVNMDYSGYNLPPVLLITGIDDSCIEDSKVLFDAIKNSNETEIEIIVMSSDSERADHCFLIERPNTNISKQVYNHVRKFIKEHP